MSQPQKQKAYPKYRIPPDFKLAQLHSRSCKLYQILPDHEIANSSNRCGCCNQHIGSQKVPLCQYVSSLRRIGQEVPLFFNFITLMVFIILVVIFVKTGEWIFFCDDTNQTLNKMCQLVYCSLKGILPFNVHIPLGFTHKFANQDTNTDMRLMIEIIIYSVLILIIKIHLKTKKYKFRTFNKAIQKRSVQLINLPKDCTKQQIQNLFKGYSIQQIVFTFRVREYHKCMKKLAKLNKKLNYLKSQIQHSQQQQISQIQNILKQGQRKLQSILQNIEDKQQRLSTAFVVFQTAQQRNKALQKYQYFFISKLFLKLCHCCSNSVIRGKHVTIEEATAPDDVKWQNLQNPYLRTKAIRFSSFLICTTILIFGIVSQVIIFNKNNFRGAYGQLISSIVIFAINFMIINFLEQATNRLEARESNTAIKLSLVRKITFFMFFNVSVSPFLIILYNRFVNQNPPSQLFDNISLTLLIVGIGNCFKPLLIILSTSRFLHQYKCWRQKSKGYKCQLNQLEANELFQPLEFPIQIYYSILHASLMMSFFYLGCFQFLILIQLPSLILLYFSAKWMLLRVCKQPRGLSLKLNNLAQSLMRFYVPLYWIGRNFIGILVNQNSLQMSVIIQEIFYKNSYQIISVSIVTLMLICQIFVAKIAKILSPKSQDQLSLSFGSYQQHNRNYEQANLFYKIYDQSLVKKMSKKARQTATKMHNRQGASQAFLT